MRESRATKQNVLAPGFTSLALHQDTPDITPRFAMRIAMYAESAPSAMRGECIIGVWRG